MFQRAAAFGAKTMRSLFSSISQPYIAQDSQSHVPQLLLESNEPPTDEEKVQIRAHVRDLEALQAEMTVEENIKSPGGYPELPNHLRIGESLRRHRSLLVGIRDVPDEVLELILVQALDEEDSRRHRRIGAMSLACRRWRQVILGAPGIWAQLPPLRDLRYDIEGAKAQRAVVEMHLKRSRDASLTFRLSFLNRSPTDPWHMSQILSLLASHSHRWHTVNLHFSYSTLPDLPTLKGRLPILHSLTLRLEPDRDCPTRLPFDHFSQCPNLRHTKLLFNIDAHHWPEEYPTPPTILIPWNQLITFVDQRYGEVRRVITKSQNGFRLELPDGVGGQAAFTPTYQPTADDLSRLVMHLSPNCITELKLMEWGNSLPELAEWLANEQVALPFLQHLMVIDPSSFPYHIHRFIQRSGCPLKSLRIGVQDPRAAFEGTDERAVTLTHIIQLCPELELVHTRAPLIPSPDDFHHLAQIRTDNVSNESQFVLLPKLNHLRVEAVVHDLDISGSSSWEKSDGVTFARMAKARFEGAGDRAQPVIELGIGLTENPTWRNVLHDLVAAEFSSSSTTTRGGYVGAGLLRARAGALEEGLGLGRWYNVFKGIPQMGYPPYPRQGVIERMFDMQRFNDALSAYEEQGLLIHKTVEELEAYPINEIGFDEALLLEKHEIITLLHLCSSAPSSSIPCSERYSTSERLKSLNSTWTSHFKQAFPEIVEAYGRWVCMRTKNMRALS